MVAAVDALLAIMRSRGCRETDALLAVHEACHALASGARVWDRRSIHRSVTRRGKRAAAEAEMLAQAATAIVCRRLAITHDMDDSAVQSWFGAVKQGVSLTHDQWLRRIYELEQSEEAAELAEHVMALAGEETNG